MTPSQSNQNLDCFKTSASLAVEYIYYAINTILFVRGFSTPKNFTLQYHFGTPIWILTNEKLSHYFKPQLGSLREMLLNRFIRKIFLYLRNSATNEIIERWYFEVECADHNSSGLNTNNLSTVRKEIRDVLRQICSTVSFLPVLTEEWVYNITVKLEEPLCSNFDKLNVPQTVFKKKNCWKKKHLQSLSLGTVSKNLFKTKTIVNYIGE